MKSNLSIFLVFIFLSGSRADVAKCPTSPFDPPQNLAQTIEYPMDSSRNYPANYDCTYQINVPRGYSAYVVLNAIPANNITGAPIVQFVDFNQRVENVAFARNERFWLVSPGAKIKLSTQTTTVSFHFSVQWYSNITSLSYSFANVSTLDTQPTVQNDAFYQITQVTASTRVSILAMPPIGDYYQQESYLTRLRSVLIFDGPNENSTCLGTAYQLLKGTRQYVSTGSTIIVVPMQPLVYAINTQLIFQDYENTKEIVEYRGIGCLGACDPIVMDGTKAASAFSTYTAYGFAQECLLGVSGTGMLDVYYGGKTESKSNLIASYNVSNMPPNVLPQLLRGVVRTYVLTGGVATVDISFNGNGCTFLRNDAQGFVTSREYKTNLTLPYSDDRIYYVSDGLFNYTFDIQDVDLSQNKSLQLIIQNNRTNVLNVVYNSTNLPTLKTVISGVGDFVDIMYYAKYDAKKGGYYIGYKASRVKIASTHSYYLLIFIVLGLVF